MKQIRKKSANKGKQDKKKDSRPSRTVTPRTSNRSDGGFYQNALAQELKKEIKSLKDTVTGTGGKNASSTKIEGVPAALSVTKRGSGALNPGGAHQLNLGKGGVMRVSQHNYVGTISNHVTVPGGDVGGARLDDINGTTYYICESKTEGDAFGVFPVGSGFAAYVNSIADYKANALFSGSMLEQMSVFYELWKPESITIYYEPEANTGQHGMISMAWTTQVLSEFHELVLGSGSPSKNDFQCMTACPRYASSNLYMPCRLTVRPCDYGIAEDGKGWLRTNIMEGSAQYSAYDQTSAQAGCLLFNVDEDPETEIYGRLFIDVTYVFKGVRHALMGPFNYGATNPNLNKVLDRLAVVEARREMCSLGLVPSSDLLDLFNKHRVLIQERLTTLPPPLRPFNPLKELEIFKRWREEEKNKKVEEDGVLA